MCVGAHECRCLWRSGDNIRFSEDKESCEPLNMDRKTYSGPLQKQSMVWIVKPNSGSLQKQSMVWIVRPNPDSLQKRSMVWIVKPNPGLLQKQSMFWIAKFNSGFLQKQSMVFIVSPAFSLFYVFGKRQKESVCISQNTCDHSIPC